MNNKEETLTQAELGRDAKATNTPVAHLEHLLNIGWSPESSLIAKYVKRYSLENELSEFKRAGAYIV